MDHRRHPPVVAMFVRWNGRMDRWIYLPMANPTESCLVVGEGTKRGCIVGPEAAEVLVGVGANVGSGVLIDVMGEQSACKSL